jgi:Malectin domain
LAKNKVVKKMLSFIVVLVLVSRVTAFEQIYAINTGGPNHTDSDGIVYVNKISGIKYELGSTLVLDNVPESDRPIYKWTEYSESYLQYNMPLKSDGLYVLIEKIANYGHKQRDIVNLTLNNEVHLQTNMDQNIQCGAKSDYRICDEYFYFCVVNNTLYFKNQATSIRNEEIHIELRRVKGYAHISGLVLLKGTLGESHKLKGSAAKDPMFFNSSKMDPRCFIQSELNELKKNLEEQFENRTKIFNELILQNLTNNCAAIDGVLLSNENMQSAVKSFQLQQSERIDQLQTTMQGVSDTCFNNNSNLNIVIQSSFENTQVNILLEIQKQQNETFQRFGELEQKLDKSVSIKCEAEMD